MVEDIMRSLSIRLVTLVWITLQLVCSITSADDLDNIFEVVQDTKSSVKNVEWYASSLYFKNEQGFYLDVKLDGKGNIVFCHFRNRISEDPFDSLFSVPTPTNYVLRLLMLDEVVSGIEIVSPATNEYIWEVSNPDGLKLNGEPSQLSLEDIWKEFGSYSTQFTISEVLPDASKLIREEALKHEEEVENLKKTTKTDAKVSGESCSLVKPSPTSKTNAIAYFEYRDHQLFEMPIKHMNESLDQRLSELIQQAAGDSVKLLGLLGQERFLVAGYEIDMNYALMGNLSFTPVAGEVGCAIDPALELSGEHCFVESLEALQSVTKQIGFLVRGHASSDLDKVVEFVEDMGFEVAVHELPLDKPIQFGLGGVSPFSQ